MPEVLAAQDADRSGLWFFLFNGVDQYHSVISFDHIQDPQSGKRAFQEISVFDKCAGLWFLFQQLSETVHHMDAHSIIAKELVSQS